MKEHDDGWILSRQAVEPVLWLAAGDRRTVTGAPLALPNGVVDPLRREGPAGDPGLFWQWVALEPRWSVEFDPILPRGPVACSVDLAPPGHGAPSSVKGSTACEVGEAGELDAKRLRLELQRERIYRWLRENPTGPALLAFSPQGDLVAEGNSLKALRAAARASGASTQGALICGRGQVESFAP